jgi:SAM-dependent methyltransferase
MTTKTSKFKLYEHTVQSPNWQVDYLPQFHTWLVGKAPRRFREDFCGSGKISCEWVKRSPKNTACGLDIDPETLDYAVKVNQAELTPAQKKRVTFLKQNVLKPTREKFDMIGAFNFSFFIFHERKELLKYAKAAHKSLVAKGTIFLELAGGVGFQEQNSELKTVKIPGVGMVTQVWEQHQYDPITQVSDFSIHFKLPDGSTMNDAFTYHWRMWQIRDLQEVLLDAGFKKTVVLWENDGEYLPVENAELTESWVAYVIGVK